MSNGSPTAYLLWAILSVIFLVFLLLHLWAYDKFKCLKWDSGRQPGAFKRVMTYSYVATLPLLVIFSVAMTALKFKEGYWVSPRGHIIPKPLALWPAKDRHWLLVLYFILSIGWSLEIVTHLEELAFWLFLLHQGPGKRDWFHSWEFRTWYFGSMTAIIGMPLITLVTRHQLEQAQAWIFLAGASAGTCTTLIFLYVLARFPRFIQYVKDGGAEPDVVVRLATFYSLNRIRVMFRFLFTVPLLIIALDGIEAPFPIIENPFALDFLLMIGGIGCFISSAITLLIFFPRSITQEAGYKARIVSPSASAKVPTATQPDAASPNPEYYNRGRAAPSSKAFRGASPVSPNDPMNTFRYPAIEREGDVTPRPTVHRPAYSTESVDEPIPSTETESEGEGEPTSPDYESGAEGDAESIEMAASPSIVTSHTHHSTAQAPQVQHHAMAPRQSSSQTYVSRPTSGGRSEDTVWERQEERSTSTSAGARRRFVHDGPSSGYHVSGASRRDGGGHGYDVGIDMPPIPGSTRASSRPRLRSNDHERPPTPMPVSPSPLHPYVINFTSPIDLLDHSQELERRLAVYQRRDAV
ncbi:hypothetical protein D9613_003309 [Agrocybe pediades]|uniref:Uncharacterized protein n=1 Tax=Agrocybe pediades TaxID=84607 RepID=A0A8H4VLS0_9AGAR|nr:hypothetical protein D9613_003309 [Agrocybe pediades]